jgi:bla regulator protein BlaR1
MMDLIADHLWQSTLWAAAVAVAVGALARQPAQVRYILWLTASLKFLVPFAGLVWIGQQLGVRPLAATSVEGGDAIFAFEIFTQPFSVSSAARPSSSSAAMDVSQLIVPIWICGAAAVLAVWYTRWRRIQRIVRAGAPVHGVTDAIPVVLSPAALEPAVFGIVRPVLLWPASAAGHLRDDEINAIVAHEISHVRRRDNLAASVHMAIQALFWFHPLVWWLGARLVDERERACDEDVLRRGSRPEVYAESILKTCRFSLESPLACVSGVTGSNLMRRIEQIMRNDTRAALTTRKKMLLACVPAAAVAIPVAIGILTAPPLRAAQEQVIIGGAGGRAGGTPPVATPAAFEVASVKPNNSGEGFIRFGMQPGGRFTATNAPLRELLRFAYAVQNFQIVDAPGWIASERFDIIAKAEGDLPPSGPGQLGPVQMMMQALLAERFGLKARKENREMSRYDLVLARADGRLGPQLKASTTDCQAIFAAARRGGGPPPAPPGPGEPLPCGFRVGPGRMQGGAFPLSQLATALSPMVQRVVIDRTGLTGNFDIDVTFTPDQMPQGPPPPGAPPLPSIDANGPSIFTALQEQLGLKLESVRGPVEVLVIESVSRPTPD